MLAESNGGMKPSAAAEVFCKMIILPLVTVSLSPAFPIAEAQGESLTGEIGVEVGDWEYVDGSGGGRGVDING